MTTGKKSDEMPKSSLLDDLQRQVDTESLIAGLNNEIVSYDEIKARAAFETHKKWGKLSTKSLGKAIEVLAAGEAKHIASSEIAANHSRKKEFLVQIYQSELEQAKTTEVYRDLAKELENGKPTPKKADQLLDKAHALAWGTTQKRITGRFGSPAPADWAEEAPRWAHDFEHQITQPSS